MPRHNGSNGTHHSSRQSGIANKRRAGRGSYSIQRKGRRADHYTFDLREHNAWVEKQSAARELMPTLHLMIP